MTNETNSAQSQSSRRAALWSALVVSAVANASTSVAGLSPFISIAFGALTFLFAVALFVGRRQKN
ncbi:hypothetical protein GCM10011609_26040 [Lentzea pudingi]|uniref:Uncharacterized protein n=1 Tax=Lentzea pudingi TaxID=1789439 RepID=A0ABQ2HPY9_9PSEU|nr:hypothetical protein [Lentzea pudingi]GGM88088.1 hypothetical protein GCM10011609_26040 [Lentzea pudingi]